MKERTDAEIIEKAKEIWPEKNYCDTEYNVRRGARIYGAAQCHSL